MLARTLLVPTLIAVAASTAAAQPVQIPAEVEAVLTTENFDVALKLARGTLNRARRAVAFGPELSGSLSYLTAGELETPIGLGLGLAIFKVPVVPDVAVIRDVIRAKLQERLLERLAMLGTAVPSVEEVKQLAFEIYEAVKAEVLGQFSMRARRLERPRFATHLEAIHGPRAGNWQGRLTLLVGVGPIAIGPSAAVVIGGETEPDGLLLGAEADLHVMLSKGPRSHPAIVFLRFDRGMNASLDDQLLLGVRVMLDLI